MVGCSYSAYATMYSNKIKWTCTKQGQEWLKGEQMAEFCKYSTVTMISGHRRKAAGSNSAVVTWYCVLGPLVYLAAIVY